MKSNKHSGFPILPDFTTLLKQFFPLGTRRDEYFSATPSIPSSTPIMEGWLQYGGTTMRDWFLLQWGDHPLYSKTIFPESIQAKFKSIGKDEKTWFEPHGAMSQPNGHIPIQPCCTKNFHSTEPDQSISHHVLGRSNSPLSLQSNHCHKSAKREKKGYRTSQNI